MGSRAARAHVRRRTARHPAGVGPRAPGDRRRGAQPGRRIRRPRRQHRHDAQAGRNLRAEPAGAAASTGAFGSTGWRAMPQRHRGARRAPAVRQHLPGLLRLHEAGDPARGDHAAAGDLHRHPRFDRPGRGRADPPADRAPRDAPGHSRTWSSSGPATRPRRSRRGGWPWSAATARPCWCSPARSCRCSTAPPLGSAEGVRRGGYVLLDPPGGGPQAILIATGSEVHVALAAARLLQADGVRARVVSLPSWELFAAQPESYRDEVLPPRSGPGWASRRPRRSAGSGGPPTTERCWPWTASAPPRPATGCSRNSSSRPSGRPRWCGGCWRGATHPAGARGHESVGRARRAGAESLVRLHHPRPGRLGRAGPADPRGRAPRNDLEPHDLREGDRGQPVVRRRHPSGSPGADGARPRSSRRSPWRTCGRPATCSPTCIRETRRPRRPGLARGVSRAGERHRGDDPRGASGSGRRWTAPTP